MSIDDIFWAIKEALEFGVSPEDMPLTDPELIRAAIEEAGLTDEWEL